MNIFCTGNQDKKNFHKTLAKVSEISNKYGNKLYLNKELYDFNLPDIELISFKKFISQSNICLKYHRYRW